MALQHLVFTAGKWLICIMYTGFKDFFLPLFLKYFFTKEHFLYFYKPEKTKLYRESPLPAVFLLPIEFDIKLYSAVENILTSELIYRYSHNQGTKIYK